MVWRYGTPPNLQIIPKWRVVAVYRVWGLLVQGLNCPRLAKRIFFLSLMYMLGTWWVIKYQNSYLKIVANTTDIVHGEKSYILEGKNVHFGGKFVNFMWRQTEPQIWSVKKDQRWYNQKNIFTSQNVFLYFQFGPLTTNKMMMMANCALMFGGITILKLGGYMLQLHLVRLLIWNANTHHHHPSHWLHQCRHHRCHHWHHQQHHHQRHYGCGVSYNFWVEIYVCIIKIDLSNPVSLKLSKVSPLARLVS